MNNSALRALQNVVLDGVGSSENSFLKGVTMKKSYYLLATGKIMKIDGRIASALHETHAQHHCIDRNIDIVFLCNLEHNISSYKIAMNEVLKKRKLQICEHCLIAIRDVWDFCPWCGRKTHDNYNDPKEFILRDCK